MATGRAVDPDRTAFELGSITKIFTATAVMQLLKDGTTTGFHGKLVLVPQRGIGVYVAYHGLGDARLAGRDLIEAFLDTFAPSTAPVPATAAGPVGQYAGTYRSTRTGDDITRIQSLFDNVTVRAGDDGRSSARTASSAPPRTLHPYRTGRTTHRRRRRGEAFHAHVTGAGWPVQRLG